MIQLVSMVSSLVTINISSCDLMIADKDDVSTKQRILHYLKFSPLMLTSIVFKTGCVSLIFTGLKYYGVIVIGIYVAVLIAIRGCTSGLGTMQTPGPMNAFTTCFREDMGKSGARMVTWAGFAMYSVTLIAIYCIDPSLTFLTNELSMQWAKEPLNVLPIVLTLGVVHCIVNKVYINYFWAKIWDLERDPPVEREAGDPEENVPLDEIVQEILPE